MKTFYLKSGSDIINKVRVESIEKAIEYFASVKNMSKKDLLRIFKVE